MIKKIPSLVSVFLFIFLTTSVNANWALGPGATSQIQQPLQPSGYTLQSVSPIMGSGLGSPIPSGSIPSPSYFVVATYTGSKPGQSANVTWYLPTFIVNYSFTASNIPGINGNPYSLKGTYAITYVDLNNISTAPITENGGNPYALGTTISSSSAYGPLTFPICSMACSNIPPNANFHGSSAWVYPGSYPIPYNYIMVGNQIPSPSPPSATLYCDILGTNMQYDARTTPVSGDNISYFPSVFSSTLAVAPPVPNPSASPPANYAAYGTMIPLVENQLDTIGRSLVSIAQGQPPNKLLNVPLLLPISYTGGGSSGSGPGGGSPSPSPSGTISGPGPSTPGSTVKLNWKISQ